ncbi:hypothetical protein BB8028_0007g00590 [Beauveria bassiana]|uniref:C2H2-type domain-containing protein n=1 Tax=Beauveria bassiana TaxID=176275 RepID=A0A2S7YL23_BEABA|nr:hypothetical protein BB8028_0007g00590 [Beauveria bassiana]
MAYCQLCDKSFVSQKALQQHQDTSSRHAYCQRCNKHLAHPDALRQHLQNSPRHHICQECDNGIDFPSKEDLNDHLERVHLTCVPCNARFANEGQLREHNVERHNLCTHCLEYFDSLSNLKHHQQTHLPRNINCIGCNRKFAKNSHMILHMENGGCELAVDCDFITSLAFECDSSDWYECSTDHYNFECPTCKTPFQNVSGLLQHAESDACKETMKKGAPLFRLVRFLRSRL